jgi:hypothetical protein
LILGFCNGSSEPPVLLNLNQWGVHRSHFCYGDCEKVRHPGNFAGRDGGVVDRGGERWMLGKSTKLGYILSTFHPPVII